MGGNRETKKNTRETLFEASGLKLKVTEKCQYIVLQDEDGMVFVDKDEIEGLIDVLEMHLDRQKPIIKIHKECSNA